LANRFRGGGDVDLTAPASHSSGSTFVRLDEAIFKLPYTSLNLGSTMYVKLPSFNVYGRALEDLSSATAYSVALTPLTAFPDQAQNVRLAQPWGGSTLQVVCDAAALATSYKFRFYDLDEVTLLREIETSSPSAIYTSSLAAADGVRRDYAIEVISNNTAGDATPSTWLIVNNAAPAAVTTPAASGGAYDGTVTCDASSDPDLVGYVVFYSDTTGFDPKTTGGVVTAGIPTLSIFGLAAGTYYARIAAFDGWTTNPDFLNLSSEQSFTISTGGGATPSGGGTGGGGYVGCPAEAEPILLANAAGDGPGETIAAGELVAGMLVWTRHEATGRWGAWPVRATQRILSPLYRLPGYPATSPSHLYAVEPDPHGDGPSWIPAETIAEPFGFGWVVKIEIEDAHTYVVGGRLSHNKRVDREPE